ncbi:hypothetical protein WG66_001685 [Moniliophthora roreri]|nr:hypothetical protein WG66_001685 [Moniliophthora roreri]
MSQLQLFDVLARAPKRPIRNQSAYLTSSNPLLTDNFWSLKKPCRLLLSDTGFTYLFGCT